MTNNGKYLKLWCETFLDSMNNHSEEMQNNSIAILYSIATADALVRQLEDLAVVENGRLFEDD